MGAALKLHSETVALICLAMILVLMAMHDWRQPVVNVQNIASDIRNQSAITTQEPTCFNATAAADHREQGEPLNPKLEAVVAKRIAALIQLPPQEMVPQVEGREGRLPRLVFGILGKQRSRAR